MEESNSLKSLIFSKSLKSLILGFVFVLLFASSAYFFLSSRNKQNSSLSQKTSPSFPKNNFEKASLNPTTSWQTYNNTDFNYSIKHPKGWETYKRAVDGSDYQIALRPLGQESAPITISSQSNEQNISAEDFVKNQFGDSYPIEKKKIGNLEAVFVKNSSLNYVTYFVNKNKRMYELAALSNENNLKIFDQVLSTFEIR